MRLVRKYPLALQPWQEVSLPNGAHILHCAAPGDQPALWAMVDPEAALVVCTVRIFSTGEEFQEWSADNPDGFRGEYRGSFILSDGTEGHVVQQVK